VANTKISTPAGKGIPAISSVSAYCINWTAYFIIY